MPGGDPRAAVAFAYAVLRVVPDVERGERLNVGVALYCRQRDFLELRCHVERERVAALAPELELDVLCSRLDALAAVAAGAAEAGALGRLPPSERFGWLVAPSSTVIQPSEVHAGVTGDPAATLARLFARLVGPPPLA